MILKEIKGIPENSKFGKIILTFLESEMDMCEVTLDEDDKCTIENARTSLIKAAVRLKVDDKVSVIKRGDHIYLKKVDL